MTDDEYMNTDDEYTGPTPLSPPQIQNRGRFSGVVGLVEVNQPTIEQNNKHHSLKNDYGLLEYMERWKGWKERARLSSFTGRVGLLYLFDYRFAICLLFINYI